MKAVARILTLAVLAASLFVSNASANHAWGSYHWARTANPFTIKVGDNVASSWDSYLVSSCQDWAVTSGSCNNSQNPVRTNLIAGSVSSLKRCSAVSGTIQVCNGTYGNNGWLGIASISVSGVHITSATVKVNDTYFNTAQYNTPEWKRMVMEQEVGHCFGLGHQDEVFANADLLDACGRGSCMDYSDDPTNQGTPNQHDYDQLVTIYSHLDATTTIGAALPGNGRANFGFDDEDGGVDPENQATWGRAVGFTQRGRANVFERELGNGRKILSYVLWIE